MFRKPSLFAPCPRSYPGPERLISIYGLRRGRGDESEAEGGWKAGVLTVAPTDGHAWNVPRSWVCLRVLFPRQQPYAGTLGRFGLRIRTELAFDRSSHVW